MKVMYAKGLSQCPTHSECSLSVCTKPDLRGAWERILLCKVLERHLGAKQTVAASHLSSNTKCNPKWRLALFKCVPEALALFPSCSFIPTAACHLGTLDK